MTSKEARERLKKIVAVSYPPELLSSIEKICETFIERENYLQTPWLGADDIRGIFRAATILTSEPSTSKDGQMFGEILQALVIEILRRGHAMKHQHLAIHARESAIFELMQGRQPERV